METFIQTLKDKNSLLFYFGLMCLISSLFFIVFSKTSSTQVLGISAWIKPFKFAFSIFIFSWTMAWYCSYLPKFNIQLYSWTLIILLGFEIVYIAIQASKGQLSHFNVSNNFYGTLFTLMGVAITIVVVYTAYVAYLFFVNDFPDLPNQYVWAIRLGLILFVIFSLEGYFMGSRLSHTVGAVDGGKGIPILNWSITHGDLRVAHFIGMHALQVLPLLAYFLIKDVRVILAISAVYFAIALFTLVQALNAKPFIKLIS